MKTDTTLFDRSNEEQRYRIPNIPSASHESNWMRLPNQCDYLPPIQRASNASGSANGRRVVRVMVCGHEQKRIRTQSSGWFVARIVLKPLNNKPNCVFTLSFLDWLSRTSARDSRCYGKPSTERVVPHDYSVHPQAHTHTHLGDSHAHVLRRKHSSAQHIIILLIKSSNFLLIACFGIIFILCGILYCRRGNICRRL